jgi:hypothetical protein
MSRRFTVMLCGMLLASLPSAAVAAKAAQWRLLARRKPVAQVAATPAPSSVVVTPKGFVPMVSTQPTALIAAPEVSCPACTAAPEDLLVPGGFAHASAYLLHSAAALQQLQVAADTTVRFTSVWPFGVQLRTLF